MFVFFYLLWAFLTYTDYGMTFDESGVYARGMGLAHYLVHDDYAGFLHKSVPDDGLVIYNHLYGMSLGLVNPAGDLDFYHFLNMIFCLLLFAATFEMLLAQYRIPWLAVLGPLFLALTPRFLGDIPGNPKDMPFAVFYFLALAGIYYFNRKPDSSPLLKSLVLGFLFGLAQCSRIMGFTLYAVYLIFDFHVFYHRDKPGWKKWRSHLLETFGVLLTVLIVSNFLMMATWPYLGANYFRHLLEAFSVSRNFFWNNKVLFLGHEILSTQLPWYYVPLWLLVTTPLFILFFLGGVFFFMRNKKENPLVILPGCALLLNLALFMLVRPVLYDGVRHFLFLLPVLAVLAAASALEFFQKSHSSRFGKIVLAFSLLNFLAISSHLVRLHPYEYVYFNELTGGLRGSAGHFDNDYWGASFKEGVEWLKQNTLQDSRETYKISGTGSPYQIFYYFTGNMKWVDNLKDADYFLSYTRDRKQESVDPSKVIHVVEREGVPLCYIFKLK